MIAGLEFQLRFVTDALFIFIGINAIYQFRRLRDAEHLYFALFSVTLAISTVLAEFALLDQETSQIEGQGAAILMAVLPVLLLKLASTVRPLRRWQIPVAVFGFALAVFLMFVTNWRSPSNYGLYVIAGVFYTVSQLSAAEVFYRESRAARGVTRQRYRYVFAGTIALSLTVVVLVASLFVGTDSPMVRSLYVICATASAALYFIGFQPPAFVRRAWQSAQVAKYQSRVISRLINKPADLILRHLAKASLRATGGQCAVMITYDYDTNRLSMKSIAESLSFTIPPGELEGIANLFENFDPETRYIRRRDIPDELALACLMDGYRAKAVYSVPVVTMAHTLTLLVITLHTGALFVTEDLSILRQFAAQTRAILENNSLIAATQTLVAELRDETGDLEEMVIEREQALRASEDELRRRLVQMSALYRELESFSYSVSHDLRAPLRAIAGFSSALAEDYGANLPPEALDYIQRISANSQKMEDLMNDMLKLSKLSRSDIAVTDVDLTDLAVRVGHELRASFPAHDVEFHVDPGLAVRADLALAKVLLSNLLGNAWKFTQRTSNPVVSLNLTQKEGDTVYRISDNGAGFDMAFADKLFKPFQRLHPANEFPGNGIGLAIVQRIVNRHGGRVWAESKPGQGARFYFTLPGRMT